MIKLDIKINKLYTFYDRAETSNDICEPQNANKPRGYMVSTPRKTPVILIKLNRLFLHIAYNPLDISRR